MIYKSFLFRMLIILQQLTILSAAIATTAEITATEASTNTFSSSDISTTISASSASLIDSTTSSTTRPRTYLTIRLPRPSAVSNTTKPTAPPSSGPRSVFDQIPYFNTLPWYYFVLALTGVLCLLFLFCFTLSCLCKRRGSDDDEPAKLRRSKSTIARSQSISRNRSISRRRSVSRQKSTRSTKSRNVKASRDSIASKSQTGSFKTLPKDKTAEQPTKSEITTTPVENTSAASQPTGTMKTGATRGRTVSVSFKTDAAPRPVIPDEPVNIEIVRADGTRQPLSQAEVAQLIRPYDQRYSVSTQFPFISIDMMPHSGSQLIPQPVYVAAPAESMYVLRDGMFMKAVPAVDMRLGRNASIRQQPGVIPAPSMPEFNPAAQDRLATTSISTIPQGSAYINPHIREDPGDVAAPPPTVERRKTRIDHLKAAESSLSRQGTVNNGDRMATASVGAISSIPEAGDSQIIATPLPSRNDETATSAIVTATEPKMTIEDLFNELEELTKRL